MFVRPEQVAAFVARHDDIAKARVVVTREGQRDVMMVEVETDATDPAPFEASVAAVMKLKGKVEILAKGSLPNDGKVIDDRRVYD